MLAEPDKPHKLRTTFQELLNHALTRGRVAPTPSCLGPTTRAAIDVVALDHPDAEAEVIAEAYDAFQASTANRCHTVALKSARHPTEGFGWRADE